MQKMASRSRAGCVAWVVLRLQGEGHGALCRTTQHRRGRFDLLFSRSVEYRATPSGALFGQFQTANIANFALRLSPSERVAARRFGAHFPATGLSSMCNGSMGRCVYKVYVTAAVAGEREGEDGPIRAKVRPDRGPVRYDG